MVVDRDQWAAVLRTRTLFKLMKKVADHAKTAQILAINLEFLYDFWVAVLQPLCCVERIVSSR